MNRLDDKTIMPTLLLIFLMPVIRRVLCLYLNEKLPDQVENDGTKDVEIMVPLKNLSSFKELLKCG